LDEKCGSIAAIRLRIQFATARASSATADTSSTTARASSAVADTPSATADTPSATADTPSATADTSSATVDTPSTTADTASATARASSATAQKPYELTRNTNEISDTLRFQPQLLSTRCLQMRKRWVGDWPVVCVIKPAEHTPYRSCFCLFVV